MFTSKLKSERSLYSREWILQNENIYFHNGVIFDDFF